MKKILYTLFSLFVLASCTHDDLDIPAPLQQESGDKVKLTFNVNIPEVQTVKTRGFGETATLSSLWLVLFDEQGYYVGKAQAHKNADKSSGEISDVNITTETPFYVELNVSQSPRIIHFIGNYDLSNASLAGHENSIISRLNVSGVQDAYWQRINVDEIAKKEGATADDNGLFEGVLPTAMNPVHLLRNFAKITVDASNPVVTGGTFVYTGFDIITTESHGSVAPYNMASDPASFPTFIKSNEDGSLTNNCVSYDDLLAINYTGFIPGASQHKNTFDKKNETFSSTLAFSSDDQYMYERNNEDGQTYVIVEGTWNGVPTYYKIDLIREVEGSAVTYFHILRNFHYNIIIRSVEGKGADSAEEAAAGAASNNIFASVELQHLTNIGDGSARLFVNYTSKTLISNAPVTLEFNFLDESGNAANQRIAYQEGNEENVIKSIEGPYHLEDEDYDPDLVENEGYSYYIITPYDPNTLSLDESITLYDEGIKNEEGKYTIPPTGLQRKIEYTLRGAYPLEATCTNPVSNRMGAQVNVNIIIDDDLPSYLFPLTFFVESSALSIYPAANSNMPVNNRTTVVDGKSGNSFGFDRVLTWEEYDDLTSQDGKVSVPCHFLTNMDESDCTIYVYNELFTLGKCTFATETFKDFINTSITTSVSVGTEKTVDYTFTTPTATNVTVTIKEGDEVTTETIKTTANETNELTYSTETWGQGVVITLEAEGYNRVTLNCGRTLTIPAGKLMTEKESTNMVSSNSDISIYTNSGYQNSVATFSGNSNSSQLIITVTGLTEESSLYFSYTHSSLSWGGTTKTEYRANATISDILDNDGATLIFNEVE